jgi:hypothetical protein
VKIKKSDLQNLISLVIGAAGFLALIILTLLALARLITAGWYLFGMAIAVLVLTLVSMYIERHFVNGEWI